MTSSNRGVRAIVREDGNHRSIFAEEDHDFCFVSVESELGKGRLDYPKSILSPDFNAIKRQLLVEAGISHK